MKEKVNVIFTTVFTTLFSWIGILIIPVMALVCLNIIDYVTRLIAAKTNGQQIESKKSVKGIYKKACMWCLISACAVIDLVLYYSVSVTGMVLPFKFIISTIVAMWLVFNEFISILENVSDGGQKFPTLLVVFANRVLGKLESKGQDIIDSVEGRDK